MSGMDLCVRQFLAAAEEDGQEAVTVAYDLFTLLRQVSKGMLLSALREANQGGICRIKHLVHLLICRTRRRTTPSIPKTNDC